MAESDLLARKKQSFVLWRPAMTDPVPQLLLVEFQHGNPPRFINPRTLDLRRSNTFPDLWEIPVSECNLQEGKVYHYWFKVMDSDPTREPRRVILCTDPTAWAVDWRLLPSLPSEMYHEADLDPAGVVKFRAGQLVPCDPGGEEITWSDEPGLESLPPNNRLVLYELPTTWARLQHLEVDVAISVGTFRDVIALLGPSGEANEQYNLLHLGVNGLQLLPPADSWVDREWGYATSNYFAADYDLGFPDGHLSPTASTDLARLIGMCHANGIRFFADVVMGFATRYSYETINFLDFHVQPGSSDPEETGRQDWGGRLFKYGYEVESYDPLSGKQTRIYPARQLMKVCLTRWMQDFHIDGIRIDSTPTIKNWDFIGEYKSHGRSLWHEIWGSSAPAEAQRDARFLVVAEELEQPTELLKQQRVDAVWNESFLQRVRAVIVGESYPEDPDFETTVKRMIDCRLASEQFNDLAKVVNYITSHDVEGYRKERVYNYLSHVETSDENRARRIKLAFVCLLTAVGIPMIFAGEEFGDQHDLLPIRHPAKQVDPVNFDRFHIDAWRRDLFQYVSRLIKFRTSSDALSVKDTEFLHSDFYEGKRVIVWKRGEEHTGQIVIVVANFSGYRSEGVNAEYRVPNWPGAPIGSRWREITQERDVPFEWIGREPLFPWEAKVYAIQ